MGNKKTINSLDKVRINKGTETLASHFDSLAEDDFKKAVDYVNDKNLTYTSLYSLRKKINGLDMSSEMSPRNKLALNITQEILDKKNNILGKEYFTSSYVQLVHSTLNWILKTGATDDGLDDDFSTVLDITSILLTKVYKDMDSLSLVTNMVYKRNRKGLFNHDLIWALFESKDPYCLYLIADGLLSTDIEDVKLAGKLLNFIPGMNLDSNNNSKYLYLSFLDWFEENSPFLYYTGESFQYTSNPIPYAIDYESKYLCKFKSFSTDSKRINLNRSSKILSKQFNQLDSNTKALLANFSYKIRKQNMYWWNKWIQYPLSEQIKVARSRIGVM